MKVGIYSPYFGILGGGELYLGTIAEILSRDHKVDLISESEIPLESYRRFFGLELRSVQTRKVAPIPFVESLVPFFFRLSRYERAIAFTADYDLFIMMPRNFRIPFRSLSRYQILHLQVPERGWKIADLISALGHLKFSEARNQLVKKIWYPKRYRRFDAVLINSKFHLEVIRPRLQNPHAIVLNPPVAMKENPGWQQKQNVILSVGRFFRGLHSKRHDVLIRAMKAIAEVHPGWRLAIVGGCNPDESSQRHLQELRELAMGLPVDIHPNVSLQALNDLYRDAAIYWHAAGFEASEDMPQRMEHFGISTVEAMSAGCVPIVYRGGGQMEIVEEPLNGYFWETEKQLIEKTLSLIGRRSELQSVSIAAAERSRQFSRDVFASKLRELCDSVLKS